MAPMPNTPKRGCVCALFGGRCIGSSTPACLGWPAPVEPNAALPRLRMAMPHSSQSLRFGCFRRAERSPALAQQQLLRVPPLILARNRKQRKDQPPQGRQTAFANLRWTNAYRMCIHAFRQEQYVRRGCNGA